MFIRLFEIFDPDHEGVIDVAEFLGGVSVFASGERDEKIRVTFDLYDTNHDGFLTLQEMTTYLTAVFVVIAETSPELFEEKEVDPVALGEITAKQCFRETALSTRGELSFSAFQHWYSQPGPTQLVAAATQQLHHEDITFDRLKQLTGLGNLSPNDLFSIFSAGGTSLTREEFKQCFEALLE